MRYKEYKEDFIKDMAEQYIRIAFGIIVNVLKNKLIVFFKEFCGLWRTRNIIEM